MHIKLGQNAIMRYSVATKRGGKGILKGSESVILEHIGYWDQKVIVILSHTLTVLENSLWYKTWC